MCPPPPLPGQRKTISSDSSVSYFKTWESAIIAWPCHSKGRNSWRHPYFGLCLNFPYPLPPPPARKSGDFFSVKINLGRKPKWHGQAIFFNTPLNLLTRTYFGDLISLTLADKNAHTIFLLMLTVDVEVGVEANTLALAQKAQWQLIADSLAKAFSKFGDRL